MRKLLFIPLAAALCALALPAQAQELTVEETVAIDRAVSQALAESGVPSAEVAVVRGGHLVLDKAWGKASETIPLARPDLRYQVASNSKQFLAGLLLLLEDDGKLSLDDKVSKWLPRVSGADRIAVRQLLSHTAGLQDYWPQDYAFADMARPVTPQEIVERWGMKPLDYEPGTRWQYSNTGYVVAGLIAEQAGGAPLWQQFEERLFRPLGIAPVPVDEAVGPAFPQGYNRSALGPVRVATPPARGWLWAAGEFSMTAAELAEWNMARIERRLLPAEDWVEMERPVRLADGTSNGYGLGVSLRLAEGRRVIDHGGAAVGFLSQNAVWVDDRAAVTVLVNGDFGNIQDRLIEAIGAIVLPKSVQTQTGEPARDEDARAVLAMLSAGQFDPLLFTENARYHFSAEVLADYGESLSPLGTPQEITAIRPPRLRGGFVNRVFKVVYKDKTLRLSTYAEPGAEGRWEQFMVMP